MSLAPFAQRQSLNISSLVANKPKKIEPEQYSSQEVQSTQKPTPMADILRNTIKPATTIYAPSNAISAGSSPIPSYDTSIQSVTKPMSMELPKEPMPQQVKDNLVAGNVSPQQLKSSDAYGSLYEDFKAGMPTKEIDTLYPEYKGVDKGVLESLRADIQAGMPSSEISKLYPELTQGGGEIANKERYKSNVFDKVADYYGKDVMGVINESDNVLVNNPLTKAFANVGYLGAKGLRDLTQGGGELLDKGLSKLGAGEQQYDSTVGENLFDVSQGAVNTLAAAYAPVAMTALNASLETLGDDAKHAVGEVMGDVGGFISQAPGLQQWRDSLPENRKQEFDSEVAGAAVGLLTGLKGKGNIIKNPKLFLKQNLNPVNIAKNFQENVLNVPRGAVNAGKAVIDAPGKAKNAVLDRMSGLGSQTKKTLESNPKAQDIAKRFIDEVKEIDPQGGQEGVQLAEKSLLAKQSQSVAEALDLQIDKVSESGRAYESAKNYNGIIDNSGLIAKVKEIKKKYNIRETENGQYNFAGSTVDIVERSHVKGVLDEMQAIAQGNDAGSLMAGRSIVGKSINWMDGVQKKSSPIVKDLYGAITDHTKESIPGVKDIDAIYSPQRQVLQEFKSEIVNSKGEVLKGIGAKIKGVSDPKYQKFAKALEMVDPSGELLKEIEGYQAGINTGKEYFKKVGGVNSAIAKTVLGTTIGTALSGFGIHGAIIGVGVGVVAEMIGEVGLSKLKQSSIERILNKITPEHIEALNALAEQKQLSVVQRAKTQERVQEIADYIANESGKAKARINMTEFSEKLNKANALPYKPTSPTPVSPQGQVQEKYVQQPMSLKTNGSLISKDFFAKKPGTTAVSPEMQQQAKVDLVKKMFDNEKKIKLERTEASLNTLKSNKNLQELSIIDRVRAGYDTQYGKIDKVEYDRGKEVYTIGGKEYKAHEVSVFKPKEVVLPKIKKYTAEQDIKLDSLKKYKQQGQRKWSYLQELMDGKSFDELTADQVDKYFEMVNKRKRDDAAMNKLNGSKNPLDNIQDMKKKKSS